jgi:hypothetical protein
LYFVQFRVFAGFAAYRDKKVGVFITCVFRAPSASPQRNPRCHLNTYMGVAYLRRRYRRRRIQDSVNLGDTVVGEYQQLNNLRIVEK